MVSTHPKILVFPDIFEKFLKCKTCVKLINFQDSANKSEFDTLLCRDCI